MNELLCVSDLQEVKWIKFEEDVEEGGNRWSKPHVATVSLHSLFELRSCILNGTILLDMDASTLEEIADLALENMESSQQITVDVKAKIKESLLKPHRHQHELRDDWSDKGSRLPLIRSLTDVRRNSTKMNSTNALTFFHILNPYTSSVVEEKADTAGN
ncbi:sodium bicarbonate cotransporter 3 [Trichonephila clavipes]|nr:sodium bicarbonate cotransporter 3 [Trichonephila clavipes]